MIDICRIEENQYTMLIDHNKQEAIWCGLENIILGSEARYRTKNLYGSLIILVKFEE